MLTLEHNNCSYKVRGFGNMFTFPPYQREGNAHKVFKLAKNAIEQNDVDVAILLCESNRMSFYESVGWINTPSPTFVVDDEGSYEIYHQQRMMLFVCDKGNLGKTDIVIKSHVTNRKNHNFRRAPCKQNVLTHHPQ